VPTTPEGDAVDTERLAKKLNLTTPRVASIPVRQVSVDDDGSALRFRPVDAIETLTRGPAGSEAGKRRMER
jgi:hypothetical protein